MLPCVQAAAVAADEEAKRLKDENAAMLTQRKQHNARMKEIEVRQRPRSRAVGLQPRQPVALVAAAAFVSGHLRSHAWCCLRH